MPLPLSLRAPLTVAILAGIAHTALADEPSALSDHEATAALAGAGLKAPNDAVVLEADVTCDGATDRVTGWLETGDAAAPVYWVVYLTRAAGSPARAFPVGLPVDDGSDLSLCSLDGAASVSLTPEPGDRQEIAEATGQPSVCATAVVVDDGLCDATRLYWLETPVGDVHLTYLRN